jgi:drug/metabolite transporter (DMT)-like permease
MEFDELKSSWQQSNQPAKTKAELRVMTKLTRHPVLKRLRIKFIIESLLLIAFLAVYNDGFDGVDKPLWANIALIASAILFIANDVAGYFIFRNPVQGSNIRTSIEQFSRNLKRLSVSSVCSAFLFGCAMILFFSSGVDDFTPLKGIGIAGMFATMMVGIYLSYKNWSGRIDRIQHVIDEFDEPS